ncbi:MAG: TraL conjugative transposon family protein [Paraprevotella sp.]|nr:TraL conjugative transposon family protein [Paraprevotella sp.]
MGKMKILIENCAAGFRTELRGMLDALPPKARLAVVAGMFAAFAAGCLYMTATAVAGFGKGRGTMEIRHMEKPDLPQEANMQEAYEHCHKNKMYGKGTEKE